MRKIIIPLIVCFLMCGGAYVSNNLYSGKVYLEYAQLWEYRRMHPEILPDTASMRLSVAGHSTTYADILWIALIQYIGDNIGNGKYIEFLSPLIEKISELHPHFTATYNLALLLSPQLNEDASDYAEKRKIVEKIYILGQKGVLSNCDATKLEKIQSLEFTAQIWENESIKNPCTDPMLAYHTAMVASELGAFEDAKKYYKIASAQSDGPQAARFLGPLTDADAGNHGNAGEKFLLIAIDGYDEAPYICQSTAISLLQKYKSQPLNAFIGPLRGIEDALIEPKDTKNPLASGGSTCYNSITRAIKQFYLEYITQIALPYPEITKGSELIEKGIIPKIPTIKSQDGWGIIKNDGKWRYNEFIK